MNCTKIPPNYYFEQFPEYHKPIIPKPNMKSTTRRYYVHKRVKEFTTVDARNRQVNVTQPLLDSLPPKRKAFLDELLSYGYNLQFVIE